MKQKICVLLLTLLLMVDAVPVMAAESDTSDDNSNYQQSEDGCKDGVCPWRKGGK